MLAAQQLDHPAARLGRPLPEFAAGSFEDRMAHASVRRLSAKEHVFCEGDRRTYVFRVEEGAVAIYKTLPDGRRQIIDFA